MEHGLYSSALCNVLVHDGNTFAFEVGVALVNYEISFAKVHELLFQLIPIHRLWREIQLRSVHSLFNFRSQSLSVAETPEPDNW